MKVLCIGHTAYDVTLPLPNYPIENKKMRFQEKVVSCGGGPASNCAYLLSSWGYNTSLASVIGSDEYGKSIKKEFMDIGVDLKYLEEKNCSTTVSYILANLENGTRTILTSKDKNLEFSKLQEIHDDYDGIFVDGEDLELSYKTITNSKAVSMLDAGKCNEKVLNLASIVDYVVCSNDFAREYTKQDFNYDDIESIKKVYDILEHDFKGQVIITLESAGSFTKLNGEYYLVPSISVKALDSTGAGDIYHASLFYFLLENYPLLEAMRLANITGALSVTKIGGRNSIPKKEEVLNYGNF